MSHPLHRLRPRTPCMPTHFCSAPEEVWVDDEDGVHVLRPIGALQQRRVVMQAQALHAAHMEMQALPIPSVECHEGAHDPCAQWLAFHRYEMMHSGFVSS